MATIEIAQALVRAGARALVATEGGHMAEEVAKAGGEIVTLPVASKSPFTMLANIRRIASLIEERGVDLVHARSRAPAWSAFLACRRTGKPFVTTYHGAYGEAGPLRPPITASWREATASSPTPATPLGRSRRCAAARRRTESASSIAASTAASIRSRRSERGRKPQSQWGVSRATKSCFMRRGSPHEGAARSDRRGGFPMLRRRLDDAVVISPALARHATAIARS